MKNSRSLSALLLLGGSLLFGQMGPGSRGAFGGSEGPGGRGGLGRLWHAKVVTGAPYSASVSNSVVQQLAGGNTIQRTTTGQVARDSEGRTYEQLTTSGGMLGQSATRTITFISDPVAHYSYVLDSTRMIATRRPLKAHAAGEPGPQEDRGIHDSSPNAVETELPSDASSGVTANGRRVTRTIPAGQLGNAQPIVSTSETWYSPALQIVVKSVRNDPRFGRSTYVLSGIVAKEPEASLFQVPGGYTVQDAPAHRREFAQSPAQ
jgi:hypothetical protein